MLAWLVKVIGSSERVLREYLGEIPYRLLNLLPQNPTIPPIISAITYYVALLGRTIDIHNTTL